MSEGSAYMGLCTAYCRQCKYRDREFNCCAHILRAGFSRGCPVGDGCDKLDTGKHGNSFRLKHQTIVDRAVERKERKKPGSKGIKPEEHERRLQLYRQGLTDKDVAQYCGCTKNAIMMWRRTHGLPANHGHDGKPIRREEAG